MDGVTDRNRYLLSPHSESDRCVLQVTIREGHRRRVGDKIGGESGWINGGSAQAAASRRRVGDGSEANRGGSTAGRWRVDFRSRRVGTGLCDGTKV